MDPKNTDKYAQCEFCNGFEHFNCANIRDEGKNKYISGSVKFVCSSCLVKGNIRTTNKHIESQPLISITEPAHDEIEMLDNEVVTLEEVAIEWSSPDCDKSVNTANTANYEVSHVETIHERVFSCDNCDFTCRDPDNMTSHMKIHTTIQCNDCSFTTSSPETLGNHIKDKHSVGSNLAAIQCTNCELRFTDHADYTNHMKTHTDYTYVKKTYLETLEAENEHLKSEVCKLKEDFERLQSIFEVTKNTSRKDNHEIDAELANVREQFRAVKEENIYLREKNDTLFKLGKMAIDKEQSKEPILEIVEQEDEDGLDALVQSVIQNKGLNPKPSSKPETNTHATNVNQAKNQSNSQQPSGPSQSIPTVKNTGVTKRPQYCHFFSNYGHCNFEENTGRKCKFMHARAPMCKFGQACNRDKCMFTHKSVGSNRSQTRQPARNAPGGRNEDSFLRHLPHNPNQFWQPQPPVWMMQQMWEMLANQHRH